MVGAGHPEDLIGVRAIDLVHPDHRERVAQRLRPGAMTEQPSFIEDRLVRLDGTPIDVECLPIPFTYAGEPAVQLVIRDITDRKRAEEQIKSLAFHDALTGLPNRLRFRDRLEVAIRQARRLGHRIAVLFLDLDRFKNINDSLGHDIGDRLLQESARRVQTILRDGDTVARLGGDEFVFLLTDVGQASDVAKVAEKLIECLRPPYRIDGEELFTTASVGISVFPDDGRDPDTLLKNADTAMYRAKEHGRDGYRLYTPAMNAKAVERLDLELRLRKALAQGELCVHYQPVVSVKTGATHGFEALVRWNHPHKGLVSPADFIPIAEGTGLILPIGEWVLRTACTQLATWRRQHRCELRMAVNLSARQFQQANLVAQVREALRAAELDPSALELEVTETHAMHNIEATMHTLRQLKALGVRISIDDFGTGHSSLAYLKRMPIDTLKLAQSFVQDVLVDADDAVIVDAIIALAHTLRLQVIAEGVETDAQRAFLAERQCDLLQGYLFSAALPADKCSPFLPD